MLDSLWQKTEKKSSSKNENDFNIKVDYRCTHLRFKLVWLSSIDQWGKRLSEMSFCAVACKDTRRSHIKFGVKPKAKNYTKCLSLVKTYEGSDKHDKMNHKMAATACWYDISLKVDHVNAAYLPAINGESWWRWRLWCFIFTQKLYSCVFNKCWKCLVLTTVV